MAERKEEGQPPPKSVTTTSSKPNYLLSRLIDLDTRLSLHIHTICQPLPRSILKALELSGDGRFWFPIPIALLFSSSSSLSLKSDHLQLILIGLLIGSLLDLILVGLIKFLIRRPRPVYNKGMHLTVAVDHWSFPSGHSSRVWFISFFLYLSSASITSALIQLGYSGKQWIGGSDDGKIVKIFVSFVCLWSATTSISRVLLGRHFVFDVIAGACLGVLEALLVFNFCKF